MFGTLHHWRLWCLGPCIITSGTACADLYISGQAFGSELSGSRYWEQDTNDNNASIPNLEHRPLLRSRLY
jgi:hypothetical protein